MFSETNSITATKTIKKRPVVICHHWLCPIDLYALRNLQDSSYRYVNVNTINKMLFNDVDMSVSMHYESIMKAIMSQITLILLERDFVPVIVLSVKNIMFLNYVIKELQAYCDKNFDVVFISNDSKVIFERAEKNKEPILIQAQNALNTMYGYKYRLKDTGYHVEEHIE